MQNIKIEVNTKREGSDQVIGWTGEYSVPESLSEAVEKYGEDVVFSAFSSDLKTNVQNIARAALREAKDPGAAIAGYVPGQKRAATPMDPAQQVLSGFAKMDADQKAALIAQLREQLGL